MEIKIGLIEDHTEFRQSMIFLIDSSQKFRVQWAYGSVEEAINRYTPVDIILLDINLPGLSGVEAIRLVKQKEPEPKIIMLTILEDDRYVFEAIKNGADGYVLKKTTPAKIIEAIQQVADGEAALTPMIARKVMDYFRPQKQEVHNDTSLTTREKEILILIAQGAATDEIANKLFIAPQTVRSHLKNIYEKLQVHSRTQMVAKAYKQNLIWSFEQTLGQHLANPGDSLWTIKSVS